MLLDEEGADYMDLNEAFEDAIQSARELMAARILQGYAPDDSEFHIADDNGSIVALLSFRDAISDTPRKVGLKRHH